MNECNYTIFEIMKYKIEFLEFLEYSLLSDTVEEKDIDLRIKYITDETINGSYNKIVSNLFNESQIINKPILDFLKIYNSKTIYKLSTKNKLKKLIEYNEKIIDCFETLNQIINCFTEEEKIFTSLNKNMIDLININKIYFNNFLFFNSYNLFLNSIYGKKLKLKYSKNDIKKLIRIMNYCNKNNEFNKTIELLKEENEEKLYKMLEIQSKKCIQLEKEQSNYLNELIKIIEKDTKKQ